MSAAVKQEPGDRRIGERLAEATAKLYFLVDDHPQLEEFDDFNTAMFFLNKLSYRLIRGRERELGLTAAPSAVANDEYDIAEYKLGSSHEPPAELWRVLSRRQHGGQVITHVTWCPNREAAFRHAKWVDDGRGETIRVDNYKLGGISMSKRSLTWTGDR